MSKSKEWFEVQLTIAEPLREPVINRLFELGAEGVNESEEVVRAFFEQSARASVTREVEAYLASLVELFPNAPRSRVAFAEVANENWAERYKEFYKAQKLTHLFFLKPAWDVETEVPSGMIPILMEPGQAFGTGLHASTILVLKLLEHTAGELAKLDKASLLDVGTGTGILAIAASKLGFGRIEALDIDPIAVTTAERNFTLNGVKGIKAGTCTTSEVKGTFDVILSNILLEAHKELAAEYDRLLAPGGHLILSGLLTPQHAEVETAMKERGLIAEGSDSQQEWLALLYRKQG